MRSTIESEVIQHHKIVQVLCGQRSLTAASGCDAVVIHSLRRVDAVVVGFYSTGNAPLIHSTWHVDAVVVRLYICYRK